MWDLMKDIPEQEKPKRSWGKYLKSAGVTLLSLLACMIIFLFFTAFQQGFREGLNDERPSDALPISDKSPRKTVLTEGDIVAVDVLNDWVAESVNGRDWQDGELSYSAPNSEGVIYFACLEPESTVAKWAKDISPDKWDATVLEVITGNSVVSSIHEKIVSSSQEQINNHNVYIPLVEYTEEENGTIKNTLAFVAGYDIEGQFCIVSYLFPSTLSSVDKHKQEYLRILRSARRTKT